MKDKVVKVTILMAFRDKYDFTKAYTAGSEVEFTSERAEYLKKMGLVDFEEVQESQATSVVTATIAETIDLSHEWQKVVATVKECANLDALTIAFDREVAGKNRKSIVEALTARIAELQVVREVQEDAK